jgi:hypothetical protein
VFGRNQPVSYEEREPADTKTKPKVDAPRPVSVGAPGSGPFQQGPALP